jgi:undecaprenyl-diphosphatase
MEPSIFQSTVLAIIQGLTEFLPVSSSAHLILPSQILSWPDQGLSFDVAVHLGSLLAVIAYFRSELWHLLTAWMGSLSGAGHASKSETVAGRRQAGEEVYSTEQYARLAWLLILATIPAAVAGYLGRDMIATYARNAQLIASTSIVFGLLLWWADKISRKSAALHSLSWQQAVIVGLAQALALIPGTSRSGITMMAALFLGFSRESAARFSFLLAIPIIAGSGVLQGTQLVNEEVAVSQWLIIGYGALVSAAVAYACIHYFLRLIERIGFLPFVVYRVCLGITLLGLSFV